MKNLFFLVFLSFAFFQCSNSEIVQPNLPPPPEYSISGKVTCVNNNPISDVEVMVVNTTTLESTSVLTDSEGNYQVFDLENATYEVTPSLEADIINGLTSYDVVKLSQAVLNDDLTAFERLAFDVDLDGQINMINDGNLLRNLILNIDTGNDFEDTWRFATADYDGIAGSISSALVQATTFALATDFVGLKVMDDNGDSCQ